MDKNNYKGAFDSLTRGFLKDVNYKPLYRLASTCLERMGLEKEKKLFDEALERLCGGRGVALLARHGGVEGALLLGTGGALRERHAGRKPKRTQCDGQCAVQSHQSNSSRSLSRKVRC